MIFRTISNTIAVVIIAVCAVTAILLVAGRGNGIARFIARRTSDTERYDEDAVTHALLFLSVSFIILEVLNLLFPESLAVPIICAAAGALAGYIAWRYVHNHARPALRPDIDNGLPGDKIKQVSLETPKERTQDE